MKAQLVLQVPVPESRRKALVVVACEDDGVVREFARKMIDASDRMVDASEDPFEREFARIRSEQLRARLIFVLKTKDE